MVVSWHTLQPVTQPRVLVGRPNGALEQTVEAQTASYVDKILKGARPEDLPIEQPTQYELVVNLRTAKTLSLTIPASLLLRATVIE